MYVINAICMHETGRIELLFNALFDDFCIGTERTDDNIEVIMQIRNTILK